MGFPLWNRFKGEDPAGSFVTLPAGFKHLAQSDHNGHHNGFVPGLVEIDAESVVYGYRLLSDGRYDPAALIKKHKIQAHDIALDLPSQALYIGDIFNNVEQFIG
jgi:hypothetical protein